MRFNTITEFEQFLDEARANARRRRIFYPITHARHFTRFRPIDALCFRIANAADYPEKDTFFKFKEWLMIRYGEFDGYDCQYIDKKCWDCGGEGCERCDCGVYARYEIVLARFILGGRVYHWPVAKVDFSWYRNDYRELNIVFQQHFQGLLPKPANIPLWRGRLAFLVLVFRLNRKSFKNYLRWLWKYCGFRWREKLRMEWLHLYSLCQENAWVIHRIEPGKYCYGQLVNWSWWR